jgi:hypothetical protein
MAAASLRGAALQFSNWILANAAGRTLAMRVLLLGYDASLKLLAAMWSPDCCAGWMDTPSRSCVLDGWCKSVRGGCSSPRRAQASEHSEHARARQAASTAACEHEARSRCAMIYAQSERQSALPCERHASNAMPAPKRAHASGRAQCHANSTQAARCQRPCGPSAPWRASHTQLRRRRGLRLDAAVSGAVVFQGSGPRSGAQLPGVAPQADIGRLTRLWTGALTGSSHGLSIVTLRV